MQRLSVTASLNGIKLQFEEAAFARLETYLADAARTLAGNPDRAEILADLEQAIAEQCHKRTGTLHPFVTLGELEPALEEIGSVQDADDQAAPVPPARDPARRLEQISEGALIGGVCQGLARYTNVDVTLLRVIAVVLLFLTGGIMIVVYAVLMLLLPYAPLARDGEPLRKIPAKSREWVELLRTKLSAVTS